MAEFCEKFTGFLKDCFGRRNAVNEAQELTGGEIGAEMPIKSSSEDRLRRVDFANRIADVLSELSLIEGRVFAIRGDWGFGKSSLKNLIGEKLRKKRGGADWIDFNPWQWGDSDALIRALFSQIADRLGGQHSSAARARAETLRRYGAILAGSGAPLKEASGSSIFISNLLTNASVIAVASAVGLKLPTAAFFAAVFAVLSFSIPLIGWVLSYAGRDRSGEPLEKIRRDLESRLRELDRPLVVFVDDIDRLEPEQIRILIRNVKANANLPNIIFVLLFQPSIVEQALDPISGNNGRAFLEKIVQANFDLPAVPVSVVHRIFGEELSRFAGAYATEVNGFIEPRWSNVFIDCIQPMVRNIRDAKRLISSIAIHTPLHLDGDVFEVNIVDFLLLEALRVFEPNLYQSLFKNKELLLQTNRFQGDGYKDSDKEAIEKLLGVSSAERRRIAVDALKHLFPRTEWLFRGMSYPDGSDQQWLQEKRVCSFRYFPSYFELQTTAGEMSERRFIEFLCATKTEESLAAAIASAEADGLLQSLAARMDESVDRLPVENAAVLLPGMFEIAEKLASSRGEDPFSSPWVSAWRSTSWFLHRVPEKMRGELALAALRKTKALAVGALMIQLSESSAEKNDGVTFPVLNSEAIQMIKNEWLDIVRTLSIESNALILHPHLVSIIYDWKNYSQSFNEPRMWVNNYIKNEKGFAEFIGKIMNRGRRHTAGDRVSVSYNTFDRRVIEDFVGIDVARNRLNNINVSDYPEYKEALQTLSSNINQWLSNKEIQRDG
ncbi:KAP family P-loop NTPase fold protein [Delftia lacustris]|uniref:KAP family P-loop NTPase fold protein n=1 Tax=Delftia TaxID=80865 RepID=UPI002D7705A6|nr:P-loop NTPase fold protein [Delftia lacustris]